MVGVDIEALKKENEELKKKLEEATRKLEELTKKDGESKEEVVRSGWSDSISLGLRLQLKFVTNSGVVRKSNVHWSFVSCKQLDALFSDALCLIDFHSLEVLFERSHVILPEILHQLIIWNFLHFLFWSIQYV